MSEELQTSELGTQEYWDKVYKKEVTNFRNHGDVGEVWFGEDISERIIRWFKKKVTLNSSVVDVGCGNGMLLVDLARSGYSNLTGIDYSEDAIVLAREVASQCESSSINYIKFDILKSKLDSEFDVVIDKGTYDAVCLGVDAVNDKICYINKIRSILKNDGMFLITSCNWTNDELLLQFSGYFEFYEEIPTPQFRFGGKVGNVVSSIIFKKK